MVRTSETIDRGDETDRVMGTTATVSLALVDGRSPGTAAAGIYRFGPFELDETLVELRRDGHRVEIQPKVFDLLWYLIERRDRVVSRIEALDTLWADAVVGEHVLTAAIHEARAALGDSASAQWALKTVPRRGYRFVAKVGEGSHVARGEVVSDVVLDVRGGDSGHGSPVLWGREREVSLFDVALDATRAGRGGLLPVIGELGMGKTRLLEEFAARSAASGVEVHQSWCPDSKGVPPLWPWVRMLHGMIEKRDDSRLETEIGDAGPLIARMIPELATRLAIDPAPFRLSAQEERFRLFEGVAGFVTKAASRCPVLLLVDDLHWADSSTIALLGFVSRQARSCPLLIVTACRDDEVSADPSRAPDLARLQRESMGEPLLLDGLEGPAIEAVIGRALGSTPTAEFVAEIEARTQGNPFFTQEISRVLRTRKLPEIKGAHAETATLPPGVRSAIEQRLLMLSEPCLGVLRVAALVGNEFHVDLVARVCDEEPRVISRCLEDARHYGVVRITAEQHGAYRFTHGLIQETLGAGYEELDRKETHEAIGLALEETHANHTGPVLEELARHFLAAFPVCPADKVLSYVRRAGERAMGLQAFPEASRHFGDALEILEGVPGDGLEQRFELLLWRAEVEAAAGEFESRARNLYIESIEVARTLGAPEKIGFAVLALSLGPVRSSSDAEVARNDEFLVGFLEEALGIVDDRWVALRSALMSRLALELLGPRGWHRGAEMAGQALELATASGNVDCIVHAMNVKLLYESGPVGLESRLVNATEMLELTRDRHRFDLAPLAHRWRILSFLERGEIPAACAESDAYRRLGDSARALAMCRLRAAPAGS